LDCVWDDGAFTQLGLTLRSKVAIRNAIEREIPDAAPLFNNILKLHNAGCTEFLGDLKLLQETNSIDEVTIHLLYDKIETYRLSHEQIIRYVRWGRGFYYTKVF
jgi:hypothetical protein